MKRFTLILIVVLISTLQIFAQKASDDFSGKWKTEEGNVVLIKGASQKGFSGTLDDKTILKDVRFTDGKWVGTIMAPKRDIKANCELTLTGDKLKIVARKGPISRTIHWVKQ